MNDTLKVVDTYWEIPKSLDGDIKLRLATRLTAPVITGKVTHEDRAWDMIEKHMGKRKNERNMEKIMKDMYEGRKSIKAPLNFD